MWLLILSLFPNEKTSQLEEVKRLIQGHVNRKMAGSRLKAMLNHHKNHTVPRVSLIIGNKNIYILPVNIF